MPFTDPERKREYNRRWARGETTGQKNARWGFCSVCGARVPKYAGTEKVRSHYPLDDRFAYEPGKGYYCRGSAQPASDGYETAVTTITVVWKTGTDEEEIRRVSRAMARTFSEDEATESVHVKTEDTLIPAAASPAAALPPTDNTPRESGRSASAGGNQT